MNPPKGKGLNEGGKGIGSEKSYQKRPDISRTIAGER